MGVTHTRILRYSPGLMGLLLLALAIADFARPVRVAALPVQIASPEGDSKSQPAEFTEPPPAKSWYFAVSGDSRDCGDIIMPKIAASVAAKAHQMPVKFYWHLGDFRALYRMDCDWAKRTINEATKCAKDYVPYQAIPNDLKPTPEYLNVAWQDFVENQVAPFEKAGIPVYLGIGNHELIKRTRDDYTAKFNKWLVQSAIGQQQKADEKQKIPPRDSQTYFHFVMRGVDFISLDNANIYNEVAPTKPDPGFSDAQLKWLAAILKADAANPKVRSVVIGMHAALPGSVSRRHAMDKTCESLCHGYQAYAYISAFKKSGKPVLVLASHSHYIESNIYDTPEHANDVLTGWIVGTAGAEQYRLQIKYGYLLVEVRSDGRLNPTFQEIKADPADHSSVSQYCFENNNKEPDPNEKYFTKDQCGCN